MGRLAALRRPFERVRAGLRRAIRVDAGPQPVRIGLGRQAGDRHRRVEVGVAEVTGAIREAAAHRLRHAVHVERRAVARRREVVALEHVEHLDEGDAAGARGRHRDDLVAAVGAPDRLADPRLVGGQIGLRDQSAVRLHLACDERRRGPPVEAVRPLLRDALQRLGQIGLAQALARLEGPAAVREHRERRRVAGHPRQNAGQGGRARVRQREPVAGQRDSRLHQAPPRQPAVVRPGAMEPRDRARHADRNMAVVVARRVVGAPDQEHLRRRGGGGGLAEVVGGRRPVRRAVDEKPAAADVAGGRQGHREREGRRDRRVDRGAAGPQHREPDLRRHAVRGDHHAVASARRLRACSEARDDERDATGRGDRRGPNPGPHHDARHGSSLRQRRYRASSGSLVERARSCEPGGRPRPGNDSLSQCAVRGATTGC